ncbi:MAG TPA: hypothetical protein VMT54_18850, partial [Candidatus Cybelea sp.]|nr:hypothetical protein [Candidatus Cybelea sp.]
MKRMIFGLLAATLLAFGAGLHPASASTILVDPSPTDSFHVGNWFPGGGAYDDQYQFTLTQSANLSLGNFQSDDLTLTVGVFYPFYTLVPNDNLQAGILYTLHVSGYAGTPAAYGGTIFFTATGFSAATATTPIPPALLLFATTLAGLGAFAYRRNNARPTVRHLPSSLVAAALVAFGAGLHSASASTILVSPNPTDSFHV